VFTEEEDYLAHLTDGWVDFPSKINAPDPVNLVPIASLETVLNAKPEKPWVVPKVDSKKLGRPPTKAKRGK